MGRLGGVWLRCSVTAMKHHELEYGGLQDLPFIHCKTGWGTSGPAIYPLQNRLRDFRTCHLSTAKQAGIFPFRGLLKHMPMHGEELLMEEGCLGVGCELGTWLFPAVTGVCTQ